MEGATRPETSPAALHRRPCLLTRPALAKRPEPVQLWRALRHNTDARFSTLRPPTSPPASSAPDPFPCHAPRGTFRTPERLPHHPSSAPTCGTVRRPRCRDELAAEGATCRSPADLLQARQPPPALAGVGSHRPPDASTQLKCHREHTRDGRTRAAKLASLTSRWSELTDSPRKGLVASTRPAESALPGGAALNTPHPPRDDRSPRGSTPGLLPRTPHRHPTRTHSPGKQ